MTRKACTAKQALEVAMQQGAIIPCYRCRLALTIEETRERGAIEREHVVPLALGGEDVPSNWAWSHKACHKFQTNGPSHFNKGDRHEITKAARAERGGKTPSRSKIQGRKEIQSRNEWPKGQDFPKRKFQKRDKFYGK